MRNVTKISRKFQDLYRNMNIIILLIGLCSTLGSAKKRQKVIYIDHGKSTPAGDCGTVQKPCREINDHVLTEIENSKLDVMVKIMHAGSAKKSFSYDVKRPITSNNNITIKQWGKQKPIINIVKSYFFKLTDGEERTAELVQQRITLSGLILRGPLIDLKRSNTQINIISCNVTNGREDYLLKSGRDEIMIKLFMDGVTCFNCHGIGWFKSLQNKSVIVVNASHFVAESKNKEKHHGIVIQDAPSAISLKMKYTVFENLKNSLELQMIRGCSKKSASVRVTNCVVRKSAEPMNITGCFATNIKQSRFESNNGGALFVKKAKVIILNNNTFVNNKDNGAVTMMNIRDFVLVNNTNFINNTQIKDGGAINVFNSHLIIKLSTFENNAAKSSGGAIYHFAESCTKCELKLENVSLSTETEEFSERGTLLYSNKLVIHVNVTGKMKHSSANNDQTSISAMESGYSMDIKYNVNSSFHFECPMHFIPSPSLTKQDVNGKVTKMIYGVEKIHCNVCPEAKYNAKPVIMRSPTPKTQGVCIRCPDGGNCSKGIQSQDDFWGYEKGKKIEFIACPLSYCCSKLTTQCTGISTCASNREGILCGSCKKNYTLSFFDNDCVKKGACNKWLFWFSIVGWLLASAYFFSSDRRFVSSFRALIKVYRQCRKSSPGPPSVQYVESIMHGQINTGMDSNTQLPNENNESLVKLHDNPAGDSHVRADVDGLVKALQAPSDLLSPDLLTIQPQETSHSDCTLIDMEENDLPVMNLSDFGERQTASLRINYFSDSEEVLFNSADKILGKTYDDGDEPPQVEPNKNFENIDIGGAAQESTAAVEDNDVGCSRSVGNTTSNMSKTHSRQKSCHFFNDSFQNIELLNDGNKHLNCPVGSISCNKFKEEASNDSILEASSINIRPLPVEKNEQFKTIDIESDYKTNATTIQLPTASISDSQSKESESSNGDVPMINIMSGELCSNSCSNNKNDAELVILSTGLLQLISLYYQCLPMVTTHASNSYSFIGDIFNFQPGIYRFCPLITESSHEFNIWLNIVYLLLHPMIPAVFCVCKSFYHFYKGSNNAHHLRLIRIAITLLILIYIPMASLGLSMITCTNINGESRYYFDANSICYTKPQILMILLTVYWIAPLPFAFYGACKMVQLHLISMKQFYLILLCPWFSLYSYYIARKRRFQKLELTKTEVQEMSIILKGVFGLFRKSKEEDLEVAFNGQAVNLARGLFLALTIPFATHHHGIRLSLTLSIIIASLYHQYRYKPYATQTLNRIAFGTLGLLLSVNIANFMEAFKYMYAMEKSHIFSIAASVLSIIQIVLTLVPGVPMMLLSIASFFRNVQSKITAHVTRWYAGKPCGPQSRSGIETISGVESRTGAELKSGN